MGYSNLFESEIPLIEKLYGKDIIKKLTKDNIVKLLGWWKEKPKEAIKLKMWICRFCKKEFDENHEVFSKNDFSYCSMKCLKDHVKANFK